MTVKLSDRNGTETTLRLSMQTVVALSTTIVVAVISGIIIWVNALNCQVAQHSSDIAVLKQVDTAHKDTLNAIDIKIDKMDEKLDAIRSDQVRRQRMERSR